MKIIFLILTSIFSTLFIASCADTPDKPYSYNNNAFYSGQPEAPMRGRGPSNVSGDSFFNKVCTPSGSSDRSGSQYDCHYNE